LHDIHHVNLVAVCGLIESRAQNFTNTYGATPYTNYLTMFERPDIDVVSVCVPSGLHSQIGQLVAQDGKHVLVEKPLALRLPDADQLVATCKEQGVTLGVVLQNRFTTSMRDLRALVDSGALGKLLRGAVDRTQVPSAGIL